MRAGTSQFASAIRQIEAYSLIIRRKYICRIETGDFFVIVNHKYKPFLYVLVGERGTERVKK